MNPRLSLAEVWIFFLQFFSVAVSTKQFFQPTYLNENLERRPRPFQQVVSTFQVENFQHSLQKYSKQKGSNVYFVKNDFEEIFLGLVGAEEERFNRISTFIHRAKEIT